MPKITPLRVVSGKFRGTLLESPASALTHPMGSREKLALFNMVSASGAKVLDAYAGSGALGIEALSRGAENVVFVEKSPKISRVLQSNLAKIGQKSPVFTESVAKFIENPVFRSYFDLILADPPYDNFDPDEIARLAVLLADDGILALSMPSKLEVPVFPEYETISIHDYAAARIMILAKNH